VDSEEKGRARGARAAGGATLPVGWADSGGL
jgi:hypothetical protein